MEGAPTASEHNPHRATVLNDPANAVRIIKEQAVEAASHGADRDWLTSALRGCRVLAKRQQYLCSDDIWRWMGPLGLQTPDNRAMGSVLRCCARDGYIQATTEWRMSERSVCHGRPVRIWKSLRYQPD